MPNNVPFVVLGSIYKRLDYHRDKSITNPERSVPVKSLAECALYCQNTEVCNSFGKWKICSSFNNCHSRIRNKYLWQHLQAPYLAQTALFDAARSVSIRSQILNISRPSEHLIHSNDYNL